MTLPRLTAAARDPTEGETQPMSDDKTAEPKTLYPVPEAFAREALIDKARYDEMYARSISDPEGFWAEQAEALDWIRRWDRVKNTDFTGDVSIRWFEGGQINVAWNCLDRHEATRGAKTAIIWEPDDPKAPNRLITYAELAADVRRFANVLKAQGVKKGDRVTIYLPMIPEAAVAMLACARIGAVHSVVFAGFSPDSLAGRIEDCGSTVLITADEGKTVEFEMTKLNINYEFRGHHVKVYDGDSAEATMLKQFDLRLNDRTGQKLPLYSSGRSLYIEFKTDHYNSAGYDSTMNTGFQATYTQHAAATPAPTRPAEKRRCVAAFSA